MVQREMITSLLICIGAIFFCSSAFVDTQIMPKWYATISIGVLLTLYYLISQWHSSFSFKIQGVIYAIVLSCALQSLYGISQYWGVFSSTSSFKVTGSFDNPAGYAACLCTGIPFSLSVCNEKEKRIKWLGRSAVILLAYGIFLANSRAGILSLFTIIVISGYRYICLSRRLKIELAIGLILSIIAFLYYMRKDSADGRLLIWTCCLNMIATKPWLGHGFGGFEAHYMDFQAQFFRQNPESHYAILADTIQQPFNEFFRIAIDYGLIGLMGLLGTIIFLLFCQQNKNNRYYQLAVLSLCSIVVFSLFSYPFLYPLTWCVVLLDLYILIANRRLMYINKSPIVKKYLIIIGVICSLFVGGRMILRVKAELKWKDAISLSSYGLFDKAKPSYVAAEKALGRDRYFLYNYAAELYTAHLFSESLANAIKCRSLWSDYDLEMLIGQNYMELERMEEAEEHFKLASDMCPNRFMPLYRLVHLFDRQGRVLEAKKIATAIVSKKVKIPSATVERIKSEMKDYLTIKS